MKRIQRKRSVGWRMPPNTVAVSRGTRWGNPFKIDEPVMTRELAVLAFQDQVDQMSEAEQRIWLEPLRGKDLACWCKESDACHADYLIELCDKLGIE